jgi:hypothetical protein
MKNKVRKFVRYDFRLLPGLFQSTITFKWPNCTTRPDNVCQPVPGPPSGYVSVTPPSLFLKVGEQLTFECAVDGQVSPFNLTFYDRPGQRPARDAP